MPMRIMNCQRLFLLAIGFFGSSCAMLNDNSDVPGSELAEFHGRHDVFWPYANAGFRAGDAGDRVAARNLYLRAYRNTGVVLAGAPTPKDVAIRNGIFGNSANLADASEARDYVGKLDSLTPLPGVGPATNDVLDAAMSYHRSLAAYDWARQAGRLGDFAGAERAFLYSLHLEEARDIPGNELISSRYYELARLYDAWGKPDRSVQCYRKALTLTDEKLKQADPVGFADGLDEFSSFLDKAGQSAEALQIKNQAADLRTANLHKQARFIKLEPYPKRS